MKFHYRKYMLKKNNVVIVIRWPKMTSIHFLENRAAKARAYGSVSARREFWLFHVIFFRVKYAHYRAKTSPYMLPAAVTNNRSGAPDFDCISPFFGTPPFMCFPPFTAPI